MGAHGSSNGVWWVTRNVGAIRMDRGGCGVPERSGVAALIVRRRDSERSTAPSITRSCSSGTLALPCDGRRRDASLILSCASRSGGRGSHRSTLTVELRGGALGGHARYIARVGVGVGRHGRRR